MQIMECDNFQIDILNEEDIEIEADFCDAKYVIAHVDNQNVECSQQLKSQGFVFHDRILRMEIDIAKTQQLRSDINKKIMAFPMEVSGNITEEMYSLACLAYTTDRRFHLDEKYEQTQANKVIKAYMDGFANEGLEVVKANVNGELLGFTIVRRLDDTSIENVLGVTRPDIKGKMVAYGLYNYMLDYYYGNSNGKCIKYYGDVSSANMPSINLHIQLGAKVKNIYNKYILRKYREVH